MDQAIKKDIEKAIRRGISDAEDNLYRANLAARGRDTSLDWGESGQSLQSIIDGYQTEKDRWERALAAFKAAVA